MHDSPDDLLTTADLESVAAEEMDDTTTAIFVDELSTATLRVLLRDHLLWLFVGVGVAAIAFVFSPSGWLFSLLRGGAVIAGFGFAAIRLFQINGILQELRRRSSGGSARPRPRPALALVDEVMDDDRTEPGT